MLFEATLHPNYLAPSNFPSEVLASSGVYVVGARPARGIKRTQKTVVENEATRTLILAASPANVQQFTKQVGQAPTWHNEKQWEELRRFSSMSLPPLESVIVRRPTDPLASAMTFEAVLTHVFDAPENEETWADEHFAHFASMVRARGGVVDVAYRREVGGLTFVPVLAPASAMNGIAQFNLLRALRPMPEFAPFPEEPFRVAHAQPKLSRA